MHPFPEYESYDALGLAQLVQQRQVSAAELLAAAVARAEAHNPHINAVCNAAYEQARALIDRGLPQGPFSGVPFLLKDLCAAGRDYPTSMGSRFFAGTSFDYETENVARY